MQTLLKCNELWPLQGQPQFVIPRKLFKEAITISKCLMRTNCGADIAILWTNCLDYTLNVFDEHLLEFMGE